MGSSKTEINLFSSDLRPLDRKGFETPFRTSEDGAVVIEPSSFFSKICTVLESLITSPENRTHVQHGFGISVTGMGSTILAAESNGEVLVPALSWEFQAPGTGIRDYPVSRTGKVLLPTYPLFKIAWMREKCAVRNPFFISLPDYVLAGFSGFRGYHTDFSFASRSLLFDDIDCDWDDEILEAVKVRRDHLPNLHTTGTRIGSVDVSLLKRFALPDSAGVYTGMHDHPATAFLGNLVAGGEDVLVNPAGTTESAVVWSSDGHLRTDFVRTAPSLGINTESAWRRDILALVAYPTLSGKILDTARSFGVLPSGSCVDDEHMIVAAPSRRRLVVEDRGFVLPGNGCKATFDDFWKAVIMSTQFEFRRAVEDLEFLTSRKYRRSILLFGGQARDEKLCRLKAATVGHAVVAYPNVNGAALGVAAAMSGIKPILESERCVFTASHEDIMKIESRYRRYLEICGNAE